MKYDETQHSELLIAFDKIKEYLESNNETLGYYTQIQIDSYLPDSNWFRFKFSKRHDFLKYIKPICNILDEYENIYYDISCVFNSFWLMVSCGRCKYIGSSKSDWSIEKYLLNISDTHDTLYDECLFKHCKGLPFNLGSYKRDNLGFRVGFYTLKEAKIFNDNFHTLFPNQKIDWLLEVIEPYHKYNARIIMLDKLDCVVNYRSLTKQKPTKSNKEISVKPKLLTILERYKPTDSEKELYNQFIQKLKVSND